MKFVRFVVGIRALAAGAEGDTGLRYNARMRALADFMGHFGIKPEAPTPMLLESVVCAFARIPYENITKIIKRAESGSAEKARRYPDEVVRDHIAWGAGGTCFSLTYALRHLLRGLGWQAECILADRKYGQDTHCALLVWIDGAPHLLDPGYLLLRPVPLAEACGREIDTGFNRLVLARDGAPDRISLSTARNGVQNQRLTYKTSPVDESQFFKAWDASFDWDMMRYPLLTRTAGDSQIYVRGSRRQISGPGFMKTSHVAGADLVARIASDFGMDVSLVARAVALWKHKGGNYGEA